MDWLESPLYPVPSVEEHSYADFCALREAREKTVRYMNEDSVRYGFEPWPWHLADCLWGAPWLADDECVRVRERLGFVDRVTVLLILGANRSGKSRYAARTVMKMMLHREGATAWCYHENNQNSVKMQQPMIHEYLPAELKGKLLTTRGVYISYGKHNGFTDNSFTLPNMSDCSFRNYEQDYKKSESGDCDIVWADELCPAELAEAFKSRVATRNGVAILTFTPTEGYSATVRLFLDAARIVMQEDALLLPGDGGEPDVAGEFGVTPAVEKKLELWMRFNRDYPNGWHTPKLFEDMVFGEKEQHKRKFEMVPRVAACQDVQRGVVWFRGKDAPHGNPVKLWKSWAGSTRQDKLERIYGVAEKSIRPRFAFNPKAHLVKADAIPKEGTYYLIVDPCSGRNYFMLWIKSCKDGDYVVKEWPGNYNIPGWGHPGPWAENSIDNKKMDGKRASAQKSFGWGCLAYKKEIARIEGWNEYNVDAPDSEVKTWNPDHPGKKWKVGGRFLDARFAGTKSISEGGVKTLYDSFDEVGLMFAGTHALLGNPDGISSGEEMVVDALSYDRTKPLADEINIPRLRISEECSNLIFAMQIYTGEDGKEGAVKDPIDCLRYYYKMGLAWVKNLSESGGFKGRGCY